MSLVVFKLDESVVTDENGPEAIDETGLAVAAGVAAPLAESRRVVIIHSGESFGHHHATEHGVPSGPGSYDARDVRTVYDAMKRLDDAVLDVLEKRGVAVLSVHPLSADARKTGDSLSLPLAATGTMFDESFVPILHGDVISHAGKGTTIVSGDDLVMSLASGLGADHIDLCSTVPGVLNADDDVIPEITAFADAADTLGGSDSTDVTDGMAAKMQKPLALSAPAYVFDPGGLSAFVAGESLGAIIHGE